MHSNSQTCHNLSEENMNYVYHAFNHCSIETKINYHRVYIQVQYIMVNVPSKVDTLCEILPRLPSECELV